MANHYGQYHPYNNTKPAPGLDQTPYRGELYGLLCAVEQAGVQIWITLGNSASVDQAHDIITHNFKFDKNINSKDLWENL